MILSASFSIYGVCFALIGPTETKRERLERQSREAGGKLATDTYLKIHENFLKENYAEVDRLAKDYLSDGSGKPNADDVLYLQALSLLKLGRGDEARMKLRDLENSFASVDRKASASASIADSYFYEENSEQAYQAYQETLIKYPNSNQTTYVLYKLRDLSVKLGKPKNVDYFKTQLLDKNPKSAQIQDSVNRYVTVIRSAPPPVQPLKQIAVEEIPFFAVQVGSFSKIRNANALINKLHRARYEVYVEKDPSSGMCRVRVGKFTSKADALTVESRLKQEGYPTKIYP